MRSLLRPRTVVAQHRMTCSHESLKNLHFPVSRISAGFDFAMVGISRSFEFRVYLQCDEWGKSDRESLNAVGH